MAGSAAESVDPRRPRLTLHHSSAVRSSGEQRAHLLLLSPAHLRVFLWRASSGKSILSLFLSLRFASHVAHVFHQDHYFMVSRARPFVSAKGMTFNNIEHVRHSNSSSSHSQCSRAASRSSCQLVTVCSPPVPRLAAALCCCPAARH